MEKDCQACGLNREDAMDRSRWMRVRVRPEVTVDRTL